jgi:hypothetical protein
MAGEPTDFTTFRVFTPAERRALGRLGESYAIFREMLHSIASRSDELGASESVGLHALEELDAGIDALSRVLALSIIGKPVPETELRAAVRDANRAANQILDAVDVHRDDVLFETTAEVRRRYAAYVLRRAALEDHGCELVVGTRGGKSGAGYVPQRSPNIDRALVEYVYDRAEAFMTLGLLPWLESRACAWFFDCHSPIIAGADLEIRRMRQQEFFLLDRPSISFGAPMLRAFLDATPTLASSPRQRRIADALLATVPGIFTQVSAEGTLTTIERMGDGLRLRFTADNEEFASGPAYLGRLIAVGDRYVSTPGFFRFGGVPLEPLEVRAREVMGGKPPCYPAIAIEMTRADLHRIDVPIVAGGSMSLAESEMLREMIEDLVSDGVLARPEDSGPPGQGVGGRPVVQPDAVFEFWWRLIAAEADEEGTRRSAKDN